MEPRSRRSPRHRVLPGVLAISCFVGTILGILNGLYLLALAQIFFTAGLAMITFDAESRSKPLSYLVSVCMAIGILVTAVAASV